MYSKGYMVYLIRMTHSRCRRFINDCANASKLNEDLRREGRRKLIWYLLIRKDNFGTNKKYYKRLGT